ncbi:MAG: NAD(+) kinase [Polyangiaceae bacterium]|nr:NAD(+) kinase [Polyangiaceae bacterium]
MRALVRRQDPTVARLKSTHEAHERTVEEVLGAFDSLGVEAVPIGSRTRDVTSKRYALVVTIGGDGTLLRASHKVSDVPVLGINSAPLSSVGFFCGVKNGGALAAIERALDGRLESSQLARMEVTIDGRVVSSRVLNDALFCHQSPAATSRYIIESGGVVEEQKSSGFWVGPAAGSTAAQRSAGGRILPLESETLQLVVREPYTPKGERYRLLRVLAKGEEQIVVRSKMRDAAIFLDGPDVVVHPQFGDVISFRRSREPLVLLGIKSVRSHRR